MAKIVEELAFTIYDYEGSPIGLEEFDDYIIVDNGEHEASEEYNSVFIHKKIAHHVAQRIIMMVSK